MSTETKIDKIQDDITDIKVIMAKNTEQLAIHIKRTEMLERDIEPIKKHVAGVNGALRFIGLAAIVLELIEAARKFL